MTDEEVGLFVKYFWDKSTNNNQITSQKNSGGNHFMVLGVWKIRLDVVSTNAK